MTKQGFDKWLRRLRNAWEKRNPDIAVDLCGEKFLWHETPFDEPLKTKEQLLREWENVLNQENISVSYEILSINKNVGIAHWSATFTRIPSKENATLDGIFKITLNKQGKCTEFHQWYNSKNEK